MNNKILFLFLIFACNSSYTQVSTFNKIYESPASEYSACSIETKDSNYLIAGSSDHDAYFIKINYLGNIIWSKSYSFNNKQVYMYDIISLDDNGFIATAAINNSGYIYIIIRLDENGDTIWSKKNALIGPSLCIFKETGKEIFDIVCSNGLTKINQSGDTILTKCYNISSRTACLANDSGIIKVDVKSSYLAPDSLFFFKSDKHGDSLYTKYYNIYSVNKIWSITNATDGYIAVGESDYLNNSSSVNRNLWIVKFNEDGDTLWTRKYSKYGNDWANQIIKTNDNNFLIIGNIAMHFYESNNSAWLLKIADNGDTIWTKSYGKDTISNFAFNGIQLTDGFFVSGIASYLNNPDDIWALKVDENGNLLSISLIDKENIIETFPNPNKGFFSLSNNDNNLTSNVEIFDILGNLVYRNDQYSCKSKIDISECSKGIYIVKVKNSNKIYLRKIIYQ